MIRALHDISIGDFHFARGDVIHAEAQELLPRRRLDQLRSSGKVEEITSELELARVVSELCTRVEKLEAAAKPEGAEENDAEEDTAERKAA